MRIEKYVCVMYNQKSNQKTTNVAFSWIITIGNAV
jgi:hypothetical protein